VIDRLLALARVTWVDVNNNNIFTAIGLSPGGSGYFSCIQNVKLVTTKFKSGGLLEKHVVATWNLGNHLSICFLSTGKPRKTCVEVAGRRTFRILTFIIIIIINCNRVVTGDSGYFTCIQNVKLVTTRFKSGGLHEKHVVATWNVGNHLSICL